VDNFVCNRSKVKSYYLALAINYYLSFSVKTGALDSLIGAGY